MDNMLQRIRGKEWANSLTRTGFLQPKIIAGESVMSSVELTKGVIARLDGYIWVNSFIAYSKDSIDSFPAIFDKAFKIEPKWVLNIINELDIIALKQKQLLLKMQSVDGDASHLSEIFIEYTSLLKEIMKYYVFAVPLTDYCEKELVKSRFEYSDFAVTYKPLEIDSYNESLRKLTQTDASQSQAAIEEHLREFAWIKTAYNIVDKYNETDLAEALKSVHKEVERKTLPIDPPPVLIGLQAGIYLRNRMKELCQQLWFYFDPVALKLAENLSISREEFLNITPKEVSASLAAGKLMVSKSEIKDRQNGFVTGFIDKDLFLLTGDSVSELADYFNKDIPQHITEFKGNIACKGNIKGAVKIIRGKGDFSKFNQGEILVTPMTTPDFILVMKKSAAIITDEGGLSCHAAIISRELHIPCIIGTKISTKVLKDGDIVEVDANVGVVKILSRK